MKPVPADGDTMGEIMFRGNITMKGYLKNPKATQDAFRRRLVPLRRPGGDAARRLHQDQGPLEGRDHLGGENISSLEVEDVLYRHPRCWRRRWWRSPTRSGARRLAPSSS
jgi:fatty-acyl-CoA synthase